MLWLLLAIGLYLQGCTTEETTLDAQRQAFQAADQALQNGQPVAYDNLAAYPLYPYLRYRDLARRLNENPVAEVRTFLSRYDATPPAERLRRAWLLELAKERRWADFLQDYRPGNDITLTCWQRQALLSSGQSEQALQNFDRIWLSATPLPAACDPVVGRWIDQGRLSPELIWQRFALALAQGGRSLAQKLQTRLPANEQSIAALWLAVDTNPRLVLEAGRFDPHNARTEAMLLYGLRRWSRQDSVGAATALDVLKARYRFSSAVWTELERQIAVFMATRGHPDALRRLAALPPDSIDTTVREWRIRLVLRQGDWPAVLRELDRLTPSERDDLRWQYWRARALESTGRNEEAQGIYRRLAMRRDYHGFLAADRLARPYSLNDQPMQVTESELAALAQLPGLQRARELYFLGRLPEALVEWNAALDTLSQEDLKKAAKLAQQWGWYYQAIATLARTGYRDDLELRFPTPYREQITAAGSRDRLDPAWLYAIARQESSFRSDALSPAGAVGLMQLLPATGRQVAIALQQSPPDSTDLLQADLNISYGSYYLKQNVDRFQGNLLLATAAYNAGPDKVRDWLPEQGTTAADVWAETIPYLETRQYVQRVMEYATVYSRRLGSDTAISARLGRIPSRAMATASIPLSLQP
ncbi:MAG: transglycosylase SLT domain-containing protein [Candidatus Competibacteraceae bacterium]